MKNFNKGQKSGIVGNYIFIDTETANRNHDICQLGAIIVSSGIVEDVVELFIKPCESFESINIKKNNIYPNMVENAETFDDIWYRIFDKYVSSHIFIAHGAVFDLTAIRKTLQFYNKNLPDLHFICTQLMAKELGLSSESREDLCKYFNLCIETSHNAFSDVKDCYNIFLKLHDLCGGEIKDFIKVHINQNYSRSKITEDISVFLQRQKNKFKARKINNSHRNEVLDLDFVDQKVTITGVFERFPERETLAAIIQNRGAEIKSSSNFAKSTTMLIVGNNAGSKKLEKAKRLGIKIINEETLYKMLEDNSAID